MAIAKTWDKIIKKICLGWLSADYIDLVSFSLFCTNYFSDNCHVT